MNLTLPHPQLVGLLDETITRLCEVMDPQPTVFVRWGLQEPEPAYKDADGVTKIIDSPYPTPGEPLSINGHRFVVVERGCKLLNDFTKEEQAQAGWEGRTWVDALLSGNFTDFEGITAENKWLWTVEVRKDDG